MMHRAPRGVVALHERETRTWYLQGRIMGGGAQEGAGEAGLAGTRRPVQQDGVAAAGAACDVCRERLGGGEIREYSQHGASVPERAALPQQRLASAKAMA